jgi:hypothetical protein
MAVADGLDEWGCARVVYTSESIEMNVAFGALRSY